MAINPANWSHVLTIPESYTPSVATSGQTLVITESVIAKLSPGDQSTFWFNVQNGGGDVRMCTSEDGTNQLPVEIVSLDNSAQTCVIWTRKPSYDGTGNLYLFIGKAGETQPPVTDPFGRNAVWQDYMVVLHLDNVNWIDSTGNGYDATGSVSVVTDNNPFNNTWAKFDQTNNLTIPTGADLNGSFLTVQAIFHRDGGSFDDSGVVSNRYSTQGSNFFQLSQRETRTVNALHDGAGENNAIGAGVSNGQTVWLSMTTSASSIIGYIDGAQSSIDLSISSDNQLDTSLDTRIGTYFDNSVSRRSNGKIGEVKIRLDTLPPEYIDTEHANQVNPATFFGAPTLDTTAAPTVPADVSYTVSAPTIASSASASLPQPVADASFTVNAPTISVNASATIPGFSASVSFTVSAPNVSSSASVTLPNPTADVGYTVSAPTFSASVDASLPQPISDLAFTVSAPAVTSSATVTEPNFNAAVSFAVNAPTFAIDTNATLPQPDSSVGFPVPTPIVSVVAIVGGIAIIVDDQTNINQRVLSTNINAPILSTNING